MMNVRNDNIGNEIDGRYSRIMTSIVINYAELILVCINVLIILYSYHPLIKLNDDYIKSQ